LRLKLILLQRTQTIFIRYFSEVICVVVECRSCQPFFLFQWQKSDETSRERKTFGVREKVKWQSIQDFYRENKMTFFKKTINNISIEIYIKIKSKLSLRNLKQQLCTFHICVSQLSSGFSKQLQLQDEGANVNGDLATSTPNHQFNITKAKKRLARVIKCCLPGLEQLNR
jgi:hypothetical protein